VALATSPTLVTPTIGVASATSVNKVAITAPATSATLTLADGSTLATSGAFSQTHTTTAATNVTYPAGTTSNYLISSATQLAANPVTGTPSNTTYLRGDGTWATVSGGGTPGGSNTQVQYNSSGSFAGSANFTFDGTNVAIGGSPSAWGATVTPAIQLNGIYGASSISTYLGYQTFTTANAYYNSGWKFISASAPSGQYQINGNTHKWFNSTATPVAGNSTVYSQAMTLDANGLLGIGTTSPAYGLDVQGSSNTSIRVYSPNYSSLRVQNSYTGTGNSDGLLIEMGYTDVTFDNYESGNIAFKTVDTERMRIESDGSFLVGTTTSGGWQGNARGEFYSNASTFANPGGVTLSVYHAGTNSVATNIRVNSTSTGLIQFQYNGATTVGSVSTNGTTTSYNVTSDQRLKTNIIDAPDGNIDQIKIRSFDWKADNSHNTYGVIAQELFEVAPYAVHKPDDENQMMAVDYSKLVPMMIKEIQQLKAEVALLKGKL
jgi:hypothetical protein